MSMDLWNIKDLEPPPVLSCKITAKEIDIRLLDIVLKNGVDFFENQQHLYTEAALLSRAVYRLKMKFRNSKDFKSVEKLCRVLRVYLQIHISKLLKNLSQSIPQNYKANKTYTLTKNVIDYALVRIQGLGKILIRILETCKIVSTLMQQRLRLGHFWKIAIVIFACASRIFVITKSILKYVCEMYTSLLPFSSSLNNSGVQWLPEDYSFPSRLDEWLNIDWLDLENEVIEIDDDLTFSYFKLTDSDDEVEFCDEYILVKDESVIGEDSDVKEGDSQKSEVVNVCEEINDSEVVNVSDVINESDVICLTDEPRKRQKKRKRPINRMLHLTTEKNIDVGEIINVSDVVTEGSVIDITDEPRKRRRKRKQNPNQNRVAHNATKKKQLRRKQKGRYFNQVMPSD